MLPLPDVDLALPGTLAEATALLQRHGRSARLVAGGTDLLPNMKRGVAGARLLVSLARVRGLDAITLDDEGLHLGALATLSSVADSALVRETLPVMAKTAALVASPGIRNLATLGGNLCLDTRCPYVDQTAFWREALGGCLKKDGTACHVVASGRRCVAAASADLPPLLVALDATVRIVAVDGERIVAVESLFSKDGAAPLALAPHEIVAEVIVPSVALSLRSAYRKLRFRDAIDFPLLGVAVAVGVHEGLVVRAPRVVAIGIGPAPKLVSGLSTFLARPAEDETVRAIAERCEQALAPVDNVAADAAWRREMIGVLVRRAFAEAGVGAGA